MYRILSKKLLFGAFAWIVVGTYFFVAMLGDFTQLEPRISSIPAIAWVLLNTLLLNPVWRFFWRRFPKLQELIYPDLNGTWKVELYSNWPRQLQLLEAAQSSDKVLDMRRCQDSELAQLTPIILEAEISQTWWTIEMKLYNPLNDTPIDKSNTISVDPFSRRGFHEPGICYIYKQENDTSNVSDNNEFYGAARLLYDQKKDQLTGLVWTARMWQRAMNTASKAVFTRIEKR